MLKNFSRLTKLNKSGLGLNADMMFAGSSRPKKYGKLCGNLAKGVFFHLCTKKTCNSYQHAVHLGEWAYVGDGDEGEVTGDAERLLQALGPDGVQRVNGSEDDAETDAEGEVLPKSPVPDPKEGWRCAVRDGWAVACYPEACQARRGDRQVVQLARHLGGRGVVGFQRCARGRRGGVDE